MEDGPPKLKNNEEIMLNHCIFVAFSIRPFTQASSIESDGMASSFTSGAHNHTSHGQTMIYGSR